MRVGQSILCQVALERVAVRLLAADAALAAAANRAIRGSALARTVVGAGASGLAGVEVALMGGLAVRGCRGSAARMLAAVGLVYVTSEVLGLAWQRERPFARFSKTQTETRIDVLVEHTSRRSFPSRHVASGVAMAVIGWRAHPRLGWVMGSVALLLGISRVAAGLHYPSDVLAGAALGGLVGGWLRE
jgi:membrane-associated phospholipid phosphatase